MKPQWKTLWQQIGILYIMTEPVNEQTQEQAEPMTFGSYVTQKLPPEERTDIEQTRLMFAAILDRLHLTLGGNNESQTAQIMLQTAINEVMTAQLWVEKALYFSDEIGMELNQSE